MTAKFKKRLCDCQRQRCTIVRYRVRPWHISHPKKEAHSNNNGDIARNLYAHGRIGNVTLQQRVAAGFR